MRIAYLSDVVIPAEKAHSVYVMKICDAITKLGHEVSLFARYNSFFSRVTHKYYAMDSTFRVIRCWRPKFFSRQMRIKIYSSSVAGNVKKLETRPDLLIGCDSNSLFKASKLGIDMVYDAHSFPKATFEIETQRQLFQLDNFLRLVVVSEAMRQQYVTAFPFLVSKKIIVAANGADIPISSKMIDGDFTWPGREGHIQVGYVGHLFKGKGMEIIVELAPRMPEIDFHIVGGTPELVRYWQQACNLPNIFFHGFVSPGKLYKYYPMFDIALAPYIETANGENRTGSPMKLFDYMAARVPILASDIDMVRGVLTHRKNAVLVRPDNLDDWVNGIEELIANPDLRDAIVVQAFENVKLQYTWSKRAEKLICG